MFWLYQESDIEKFRDLSRAYKKMNLNGQAQDATRLGSETLARLKGSKINEIWLPVIRLEEDEQLKMQYYLRLTAGNPNNETLYSDIRGLLDDVFPKNLKNDEKDNYLKSLANINNVRDDLLKKYGLFN